MPGAEWFPGAQLNYAEHLFRGARPGETAIVHASESEPLRELTWDELADQVARCAAGLRRLGVERGDRVAAYMPNVPETVVAFLACASIGAVWSSCAPEFGTPTVVDRFKQIEPKVLIATEGYRYGGKDFDRRERVAEIVAAIPSIEHTVLVPSGWDELLAEPAELELRARAVRPPALGPLLVGHDGPPEGDRPGAGRHPPRAPEEVAAAQRPRSGRPILLVHHHRLDDVELPGGRAVVGRRDRALRRSARSGAALAVRRRGGGDLVWNERRIHRRLDEGRGGPAAPAPTSKHRLDGLTAADGGLRVDLSSSSRMSGSSRPAEARTSALPSSARARSSPCTRASCRRAAWGRRWRRGARTAGRS